MSGSAFRRRGVQDGMMVVRWGRPRPKHLVMFGHTTDRGATIKLWLSTDSLARSKGFRSSEISEIMEIVRTHQSLFQDRWDEHFHRQI